MAREKKSLKKRKVFACFMAVAFLLGEILQPADFLEAEENTVPGIEISVVTVEGDKGTASDTKLETALRNLKTESGIGIQLTKIKELAITGGKIREEDWTYICTNSSKFSSLTDIRAEGAGGGEGAVPTGGRFPSLLERVIIPEGITSIGSSAFSNCNSLKEVTVPGSVKEIGNSAFFACNNLEKINLSEGLEMIGQTAFSSCEKLRQARIPDSVTEIGKTAFYSCQELEEVILPQNLISIKEQAFAYCAKLVKVVIPGNVKEMGTGAFSYCRALEEVVVEEGVETIGMQAFMGSAIKNIMLPGSVKEIGNSAFGNCSNLEKAVAQEGTTSIGSSAFSNCNSLKEVTIPGSVKEIESNVFWECNNLMKVTLSEGLEVIGPSAFGYCQKLEQVRIPDSVTKIGYMAFEYCEELKEVILPRNLVTIEGNSFFMCKSLLSITIPDGVTTIGSSAFARCRGLKKAVLPKSLAAIEASLFYGCSNLTEITVPAGVASIGTAAFNGCSNLSVLNLYVKETEAVTPISTNDALTGPFADCPVSRKMYLYTEEGRPLSESTVPTFSDAVAVYGAVEDNDTTDGCWWGWQTEKAYSVVSRLTNLTASNGAAAWRDIDGDYRTTLIPAASTDDVTYMLPEEIVVKVGSNIISPREDYTYNPAVGTLLIKAGSIDGDIEIEAAADEVVPTYKITVKTSGNGRVRMETSVSAKMADKNGTQEISVSAGDQLHLNFMPDEGASLSSLKVDGEEKAVVKDEYSLSDVREVHTIQVVFIEKAVVTPSPAPTMVPTVSPGLVPTPTPIPTVSPSHNPSPVPTVTPVLDKDASDIADGLGVSGETAQKIQETAKELNVSKDTILVTNSTITSQKTDKDIKGAYFARIQARASKTTQNNVKLVWNKVKGADGYLVYGNHCNTKKWIYEYKLAKTITNNSKCSYIKKKCKKGSYYKFIVRAYKNIDGKKVTIAVSKTIHVVTNGGKNGNAGSVRVNKGSVSLKKGKKFQIKAKEIGQKKKLQYHRKACYESSNPEVASVSKKGIIKAKKKGKCAVYVYAQNGIYKKIKVTVKK